MTISPIPAAASAGTGSNLMPAFVLGSGVLNAAGTWAQSSATSQAAMDSLNAQSSILASQSQLALLEGVYAEQMAQAQAEAAEANADLQFYEAEATRKAAEFNASALEAEAEAVEQAYAYEIYKLRDAGAELISQQVVAYADAGVNAGTGSAMDVFWATQDNLELEAAALKYEGAVQATKLRNTAALTRWTGEVNATVAEAQGALDLDLAANYIHSGKVQRQLASEKAKVYDQQQSVLQAEAAGVAAKATQAGVQAGASLLGTVGQLAMMGMK